MTSADAVAAIRFVGEHGLLIDVHDSATVHRLSRWIRRYDSSHRLRDVIPGAGTVFVVGEEGMLRTLSKAIPEAEFPPVNDEPPRTIQISIRYDGIDLPAVASATGLTVGEVIQLHSQAEYRVDFFGFAPGQAFFAGVPAPLQLPRRPDPRTSVPAGSLGVANEYSVIYPPNAPGGWSLIGHRTSRPLWDLSASPPNQVSIGDRVVFRVDP